MENILNNTRMNLQAPPLSAVIKPKKNHYEKIAAKKIRKQKNFI